MVGPQGESTSELEFVRTAEELDERRELIVKPHHDLFGRAAHQIRF
jgi:hypothetical protein